MSVNMWIVLCTLCTCSLLLVPLVPLVCTVYINDLLVGFPDTRSSVGLKTVIAELPRTTQTVATNASRNITGKLVDAISRPVRETTWRQLYAFHSEKTFLFALVGPQPVRPTRNIGHCRGPGAQIWR